ncbi:MAG: hypothetical protein JWN52_8068 [Actinomycetia bacterium]|nr:hypothetical protein [Actinomycetes bacterium]
MKKIQDPTKPRLSNSPNGAQRSSKDSPASTPVTARRGDRLLPFVEILEITTLTEGSIRWLRHKGEGPRIFRLHSRLVAWESDVISWIEEQARQDELARA